MALQKKREELVYQAKLAEQAERFDEMVQFMKSVAQLEDTNLSIDERNLLSVAYKNAVGNRRSSVRVLSSMQQSQKNKDPERQQVIDEYLNKVEKELKDFCLDAIHLLDNHLIKFAGNAEAAVYFHKMKGDYYRYLAEALQHVRGADFDKYAAAAGDAYNEAKKRAESGDGLSSTNPIRLGLALNYSVFFYEILDKKEEAVGLARKAFDDAADGLKDASNDQTTEDTYKDSTLIMQLLKDNISLWSQEDADEYQ